MSRMSKAYVFAYPVAGSGEMDLRYYAILSPATGEVGLEGTWQSISGSAGTLNLPP